MWQEVLAVDSKLSQYRPIMAQDQALRPLYLKRRLQLLQDRLASSSDGEASGGGVGPVRQSKYLSLRVKLLKRQFGLPSDVLSLKSLSIAGPASGPIGLGGGLSASQTGGPTALVPPPRGSDSQRYAYHGVHHIFDQHKEAITRLQFLHNDDRTFVCSSLDGSLSICHLTTASYVPLLGHSRGVLDFDISESNQLLVSGSLDGSLILWDIQKRSPLRCVREPDGSHLSFCRFLPGNNNLIVCGVSSGQVRLVNVSTGKFTPDASPMLGQALAVEVHPSGHLLWVGNDRGHIESFRLRHNGQEGGHIQKGSRTSVQESQPVTGLAIRGSVGPSQPGSVLLVNLRHAHQLHLFKIVNEFGAIEPWTVVRSDPGTSLRCALFAPILSAREGTCLVGGSDDGTLSFFVLERASPAGLSACVNTLQGHAQPVISLGFSFNENFLASADSSGQIIVWKK